MQRTDREIMDRNEIYSILARGKACHLALIDGDMPYVVALNYGVDSSGDLPVFYFHGAPKGKKLDCIRAKPVGCLIVDVGHELVTDESPCEWGMKYSSVVARGRIEFVETLDEKKKGLDLLMRQYSDRTGFTYDQRVFSMTAVFKLVSEEVTAKRKP